MEGVTTAIVAFIFVCIIYPHLIKNRPQFWSALGMVLAGILLDAIGHMAASPGALERATYVLGALLQIASILLLVMSAGGLTPRQLAGEVGETIEVIRRGGETKEVIVPLRGEVPKARRSDTNE